MGLFYRLSPIVLMGGTLVPIGGHNPIEPAKLGAAILHGPHVHTATEIYEALDRARGAADGEGQRHARAGGERIARATRRSPATWRAPPARRCRPSAARWTAPCNPSSPSSFRPSSGRGADARAALLVAILSLAAGPSAAPGRPPLRLRRRHSGCGGAARRRTCPSSASATSPSAAPARRRPRLPSPGCSTRRARARPSCRAAMAAACAGPVRVRAAAHRRRCGRRAHAPRPTTARTIVSRDRPGRSPARLRDRRDRRHHG